MGMVATIVAAYLGSGRVFLALTVLALAAGHYLKKTGRRLVKEGCSIEFTFSSKYVQVEFGPTGLSIKLTKRPKR
jgi:hypothetical protein